VGCIAFEYKSRTHIKDIIELSKQQGDMNRIPTLRATSFFCLAYLFVFAPWSNLYTQPQLSNDDKREISYQAKLLINEMEILLNVLSIKGTTLSESQIITENSYASSSTQIFRSDQVVMDDDIDPMHTVQPLQNPSKITIKEYLNAIYLLYNKSDQPSIEFTNIKASEVKQRDYIYVQVLFDSKFNNSHKEINTPYQLTQRVAEVRAEFVNNTWQTQIASVIFWDPSRVFQDTVYTADASALLASVDKNSLQVGGLAAGDTESPRFISAEEERRYREFLRRRTDSITQRRMDSIAQKFFEDYYKKLGMRQERERKEMEAQFTAKMENYKTALDGSDYQQAKRSLEDAKPFAATAAQKALIENGMLKVNRILTDRARLKREKLEDAQMRARRFSAMKYYDDAVRWYREALKLEPSLYGLNDSISKMSKMDAYLERFRTQVKQNPDEAIKELNREIRDNRNIADLYLLRGWAYEKDDKAKKAFDDYEEAIDRYPNYRDAFIQRGNLFLKEGDATQTVADYSMALAIYDQDTGLCVRKAKLHLQLQEIDKAVDAYSKAIAVYPNEVNWYMIRGRLHRQIGQYDHALNNFAQAASLAPNDPQTWYHKGLAYVDLNDLYGAASEFAKARSLNLDYEGVQQIKAIAYATYQKGLQATEVQSYRAAIDFFDKSLAISAEFKEAWYEMGKARLSIKDALGAINNFSEAINLDDQFYEAFYQRGIARVQNDQLSLAAKDFEESGRIQPSFVEAHIKAGDTYTALKRFSDGLQAYRKVIALDAENERVYYRMGILYAQMLDYQNALRSFETAIDLNKEFAEAYYQKALVYLSTDKVNNAESDLSDAIKYDPNFAEAYFERGKIYRYEDENISKALEDFTAAVNAKDGYTEALVERGKAYLADGTYNQAYKDLELAAESDNSLLADADFRYHLGMSNLNVNQAHIARGHFQEAQQLSEQEQPRIIMGLAYCDLMEQRFDPGYELLQEALKKGNFTKKEVVKTDLGKRFKKDKRFKRLVKAYL